jgi:hypothetical protein
VAVGSLLAVAVVAEAAERPSSVAPTRPVAHGATRPYVPSPIPPLLYPPLAHEGRWIARDIWHAGAPLVATTFFRSSPGVTAYVAWMRPKATTLGLYLGYKGPGPTPLGRGPEMVPYSGRGRLLAVFNSGFYEADSSEGFYTHRTLYDPMVTGHATLVAYSDGQYNVIPWHAGRRPPPGVTVARQNLWLLVNNSRPTPGSAYTTRWGVTLGGATYVWRSGVGIDHHGDLIYIAAPEQTSATFARLFVHAGCVRAMEMDINPAWPIFVTYGAPGAGNPSLNVANPNQVPSRFLYVSKKDFFALYVTRPGVSEAPW